jgi:IMP dehydrogenase
MVLRARDIMQRDLLTLDGGTSAADAAQTMMTRRTGYAIVLEGGEPVGIVTEWDFLSKVLSAGRTPRDTPIRAIASAPLVTAEASAPTEDIVALMDQRGIRRMILTENGRIVGVITAREVLHCFREYVDRVSSDISRMHPTPP